MGQSKTIRNQTLEEVVKLLELLTIGREQRHQKVLFYAIEKVKEMYRDDDFQV